MAFVVAVEQSGSQRVTPAVASATSGVEKDSHAARSYSVVEAGEAGEAGEAVKVGEVTWRSEFAPITYRERAYAECRGEAHTSGKLSAWRSPSTKFSSVPSASSYSGIRACHSRSVAELDAGEMGAETPVSPGPECEMLGVAGEIDRVVLREGLLVGVGRPDRDAGVIPLVDGAATELGVLRRHPGLG